MVCPSLIGVASAFLAVPVLSIPLGVRDTATDPIVNISYGAFQGSTSGNVAQFLGIPFAQPPIGSLRFGLPQPPEPLEGIQQATSFGPACPQQEIVLPEELPSNFSIPVLDLISEDCLYANVWAPADATSEDNLPVIFWIYGGGFELGSASIYDGSLYVERSIDLGEPVIFVSHNYRMNAFGFLAGQEVEEAGLTNVGLRDQRLALEWVNQYISAFGGDPSKVIIWGESAGAFSVAAHLVWNNGDPAGLFRGAIMESGFPIALHNVSEGQPSYDQLVQYTGCANSSDTLDCLRYADYETLQAAIALTPTIFSYTSLNLAWEPRIDGTIILQNGERYIEQGIYAKVPIIAGDCDDEGTLFSLSNLNITTDDEFLTYIQENYIIGASDADISLVGEAYPSDPSDGSPFDTGDLNDLTPQFKRIAAFQGDWMFQAPRRYMLETLSKTQDTWGYLYKRGKATPILGTFHASDLVEYFTSVDYIGVDAIINFANTLNPNTPPGLPGAILSLLSLYTWDQWGSNPSSPPLLTFVDPAPLITTTADTYRADAMQLLTNLSLQIP
ncbi:uncharacterized protein FIBRA_00519 [Fibroporia radiculosa]|uniref:Carboxylic ester hydrolase n=1 Tax=Fibroporia radiculosa TaxID=599839 RepID=J4GHZ5_9APHY|nr:uncharacterized protein FIBRA_00519 [Fibroporia radiculosa]CCL98520.1 predicted protein [Fibroporia radiculosa]